MSFLWLASTQIPQDHVLWRQSPGFCIGAIKTTQETRAGSVGLLLLLQPEPHYSVHLFLYVSEFHEWLFENVTLQLFFFPMRGTITSPVNRRHYLILAYEALRDLIPTTQAHASKWFTAPQSLQFPHPHLCTCSASSGTPTSHPTSLAQPSAPQVSA